MFFTKKIFLLLLSLVSVTNLYAYDFQIDGIYYKILSSQELTLEVTRESEGSISYSESVTIPETIEYRNRTFTVTSIGDYAFYNCSNLKEVTISSKISQIGKCAFYGCSLLSEINIPNNVASIGGGAFQKCRNLTSISLPSELKEIPNGLLSDCTNLNEIAIPLNVHYIGNRAFQGCSSLSSITIPGSVTSMGEDVFVDCSNLKKVIFEEGEYDLHLSKLSKQKYVDPNPNGLRIDRRYGYFHDCPIEEVVLNRNVWSHYSEVAWGTATSSEPPFSDIESFTTLKIREQVTTITRQMFGNCKNLKDFEFGENITEIYEYAFSNCTSLETLCIPNEVTTIGRYAFSGCSNIKNIIFGEKVSSIGDYALDGLENLETIYLLSTNPPNVGTYQKLSNSVYTFTDIYVPNGTKEQYEANAFWQKFSSIQEFDPTGIISVSNNNIINANLFDISGRRLSEVKKGINIINSRKVFVR